MPKTLNITILSVAVILCLFTAVSGEAQSVRKMKKRADESFQKGNYYNAAKWYAAVLYDSPLVNTSPGIIYPFQPLQGNHTKKIKPELRNELLYYLAESYRSYSHYKDALPQYEQYIASQDIRFPLAKLWYAECLLANDEPEKASRFYTDFLQQYRKQDSFLLKARMGLSNAGFAANQKRLPARAQVSKIPLLASEDGSNFALTPEDSGRYLFTSSRHELDKNKEKIFPVQLYSADFQQSALKKFSFAEPGLNMGTPVVAENGYRLFFTGWKEEKNGTPSYYKIYTAEKDKTTGLWGNPQVLGENVNLTGYQAKQPFVTADNRYLLFASDRPGGFGRFDIWVIGLTDGKPAGTAINAGAAVNTTGEEASPFYDAVTGELFFSSNGRVGMGGMDIYKVSGDIASLQWKEPTMNLGYPFNSVKDDLYYIKDKSSDTAYLSSDRASGCCVEIFKAVAVHYADTISRQPVVTHTVLSEPAAVTPVIDSFTMRKKQIDSLNAIVQERLHINYRFASSRIRTVDYPQLQQVVTMLNKDSSLNILIASFTDCIGSKTANEALSRKRSESVRKYLLGKGIASSRINLDFFGKKHPVLACREDSTYQTDKQMANRRSDLILTRAPHPVWVPTGKELDIDDNSSYTLIAENNKTIPAPDEKKKDQLSITKPGTVTDKKPADKMNTDADAKNTLKAEAGNIGNHTQKMGTNSSVTGSAYRKEPDNMSRITTEKQPVTDSKKTAGKAVSGKQDQATVVLRPEVKTMQASPDRKAMNRADSMLRLQITALIQPLPRLKAPTVIESMTSRTPKKSVEVYTSSDSVKVELYDNGVYDKDSVSVIFNKELVAYKEELHTNKPVSFYVKLSSDIKRNEMIFFAENLGLTPPNSALMVITDGENKRTEINVSSDLEHNAVIYFIKVKK